MSAVLDYALVATALAMSLAYALMALGPRSWRRAILSRIAGWAAAAPAGLGLSGLAVRLGSAAGSSGSCGGCEGCGSEDASKVAEIKIPLASIGRRRP
jgi:uncharacterized protein DUF6587